MRKEAKTIAIDWGVSSFNTKFMRRGGKSSTTALVFRTRYTITKLIRVSDEIILTKERERQHHDVTSRKATDNSVRCTDQAKYL